MEPKSVNMAKLTAMTDAALQERIQRSGQKVEAKTARITQAIKKLEQQLAAYVQYRSADVAAAKKILEERGKAKTALPKGNAPGKAA
jgi:hypothetical protein